MMAPPGETKKKDGAGLSQGGQLVLYGSSRGQAVLHESVRAARRERDDLDRFVASMRRRRSSSLSVADNARLLRERRTEAQMHRYTQVNAAAKIISRLVSHSYLLKSMQHWQAIIACLTRIASGLRLVSRVLIRRRDRALFKRLHLWCIVTGRLALLEVADERNCLERSLQQARSMVANAALANVVDDDQQSRLAASDCINEAPLSLSTMSVTSSLPPLVQTEDRATSPMKISMTTRGTSPQHNTTSTQWSIRPLQDVLAKKKTTATAERATSPLCSWRNADLSNKRQQRDDDLIQYFSADFPQRPWSPISTAATASSRQSPIPKVRDCGTSPISFYFASPLPTRQPFMATQPPPAKPAVVRDSATSPKISAPPTAPKKQEIIKRGSERMTANSTLSHRELILRAIDREQQLHRQGLVALAVEVSSTLATLQQQNIPLSQGENELLSEFSSENLSQKSDMSPHRIAEQPHDRAHSQMLRRHRPEPHIQAENFDLLDTGEYKSQQQRRSRRSEINSVQSAIAVDASPPGTGPAKVASRAHQQRRRKHFAVGDTFATTKLTP